MRIAIYDLDKTLTRRPTFTPFLAFAARRIAPWRLVLFPVWVMAMLGYRAGLYDRTALKTFGMRLMTGNPPVDRLVELGRDYATFRIAQSGWMPGALRKLDDDHKSGTRLLLATAAFGFYARAFAARLDIEEVIGTQWDGQRIPGGNCYGETKKARVLAWMEREGIARDNATIRFLSDSFADAPLLDWVDEAIFVTGSAKAAAKARARGWTVQDLSR